MAVHLPVLTCTSQRITYVAVALVAKFHGSVLEKEIDAVESGVGEIRESVLAGGSNDLNFIIGGRRGRGGT